MTVSVCITHEEDLSNTFNNQWAYVLSNFKPDKVYIKGIDAEDRFLNYKIFQTIPPIIISDYSEIAEDIVFLSPPTSAIKPGTINLKDFTHPASCCYVFGANNGELSSDQPGNVVFIQTDNTDELFNFMVYAIVAWDRNI